MLDMKGDVFSTTGDDAARTMAMPGAELCSSSTQTLPPIHDNLMPTAGLHHPLDVARHREHELTRYWGFHGTFTATECSGIEMTAKRRKPRAKKAASESHDVALLSLEKLSLDESCTTWLVFSDEQVEFLEQRRRLASQMRPMERVGGSSLRAQCPESLPAP